MKLKTSCYDSAFFRTGFKRFAPLFALYSAGLVLLTVGIVNMGKDVSSGVIYSIQTLGSVTALYQFAYALVLARLLLGDLYTPRLCYAIYSLPVTRGGWFGTQVILGLLSVIPGHLLSAGLMLLCVTRFQIVIGWWMAGSLLQFLFFFGVALLCGVCAGNRIGMVLLYAIVNFADVVVTWIRMKIFAPLIYGMYIPDETCRFSPLFQMLNKRLFRVSEYVYLSDYDGPTVYFQSADVQQIESTGALWEMLLYAAIGCAAVWLASVLLRKRKPECAGDLLAFPVMSPAALVLCTLGSGVAFHAASSLFGWQMGYLMLAVGLVVGYYGCLMLLRRQVNVFTGRSVLPLAAMGAVVVLALTVTGLDLFGTARRVPEIGQVEKAELMVPYGIGGSYTATEPEDIEAVVTLQRDALEEHRQQEAARPLLERIFGNEETDISYLREDGTRERVGDVFITYTLKSGAQISRCYHYRESAPHIQILRDIFSQPEYVFGELGEGSTCRDLLDKTQMVQVNCWHNADEYEYYYNSKEIRYNITAPEEWEGLVEAMLADCADSNMAQVYFLHADDENLDTIYFFYQRLHSDGTLSTASIGFDIYASCENTLRWLVEHGYHEELQ